MVILILSAPLALLLYMGFESLWTEAQLDDSAAEAAPAKTAAAVAEPSCTYAAADHCGQRRGGCSLSVTRDGAARMVNRPLIS